MRTTSVCSARPRRRRCCAAVNRLMDRLKLPVNARKTRCLRCPEESHRVPRVPHRLELSTQWTEAGTSGPGPARRAFKASAAGSASKRTTGVRDGLVRRGSRRACLNRLMSGWANYFDLGQVSPAYKAVDRHATRRLRQWFRRKHKATVEKLRALPRRMAAGPLRPDVSWA